jgi:hypothetical protein
MAIWAAAAAAAETTTTATTTMGGERSNYCDSHPTSKLKLTLTCLGNHMILVLAASAFVFRLTHTKSFVYGCIRSACLLVILLRDLNKLSLTLDVHKYILSK